MRRLSIQARITLLLSLFLFLLVSAALALLYFSGQETIASTLENDLHYELSEAWQELGLEEGALRREELETFSDGVYLTVYDSQGHPIYGRMPYGYADQLAFRDQTVQTAGDWMICDRSGETEEYGQIWLRGIVSRVQLTHSFAAQFRRALLLFPGMTLAAMAVCYLIVRSGFRPIHQIARTAERVGSGNDLSQRIGMAQSRDEVAQLAAAFDHMLDRLQASFQRERQFTSDVSHELRTPVAVILSQCEDSLEGEASPQELREALEVVHGQARRISSLIHQLLTLARADQGRVRLQWETLSFTELCQMAADQVEEAAARRNIRLETRIDPNLTLEGDETLLMRMLVNLLDNGVKYGREGGSLTLEVHRVGRRIMGAVADDGIGIAPEQLPHIWERFYQADPARSSGGGMGLGLSMVRFIVQAHGGTIEAQSAPGEGTVFSFSLPVEKKFSSPAHS